MGTTKPQAPVAKAVGMEEFMTSPPPMVARMIRPAPSRRARVIADSIMEKAQIVSMASPMTTVWATPVQVRFSPRWLQSWETAKAQTRSKKSSREVNSWLAPATASSVSPPSGPSGAPASSASSSGSVGASGASSFTQDLRGTWEQGGAGGDAGAIVRGREDPPCTRQSPLTLATFRSWGIHWMTSHEGPGESVPDGGGTPVRSPVTRG